MQIWMGWCPVWLGICPSNWPIFKSDSSNPHSSIANYNRLTDSVYNCFWIPAWRSRHRQTGFMQIQPSQQACSTFFNQQSQLRPLNLAASQGSHSSVPRSNVILRITSHLPTIMKTLSLLVREPGDDVDIMKLGLGLGLRLWAIDHQRRSKNAKALMIADDSAGKNLVLRNRMREFEWLVM